MLTTRKLFSILSLIFVSCIGCAPTPRGGEYSADSGPSPDHRVTDGGTDLFDEEERAVVRFRFEGPMPGFLPTGGDDREVLTFSIESEVDILILNLPISIHSTGAYGASGTSAEGGLLNTSGVAPVANIKDIKVTDDVGRVIGGPIDAYVLGADDVQQFTFLNQFSVPAGHSRFCTVSVDIVKNPRLDGEGLSVYLEEFPPGIIVTASDRKPVSAVDIRPGIIRGEEQTIVNL